MYALFTEVAVSDSAAASGRQFLSQHAVPAARERGARSGYWLAPERGRGVAVVVFETEADARKASEIFRVGEAPVPNAPPGVTLTAVEVREVLAAL